MSTYSEKEWQTLLFGPMWLFQAVAGADGLIDKKEWMAFFDVLSDADGFENALTKAVFKRLLDNFERVSAAFEEVHHHISAGLQTMADLVDEREDPDDAYDFKANMLELATEVAERSGGGLFKSGISEIEKEAISYVFNALNMTEAEFYSLLEDFGVS